MIVFARGDIEKIKQTDVQRVHSFFKKKYIRFGRKKVSLQIFFFLNFFYSQCILYMIHFSRPIFKKSIVLLRSSDIGFARCTETRNCRGHLISR